MSNTSCWWFGPLEDIHEGDALLIPKIEARTFPAYFSLGIFCGGAEWQICRHIVALSPSHSDITRFRPWSPIATGNHWDRAEPKKTSTGFSDDWQTWHFHPHSGISGTTLRRDSAFPNLHEWWTKPAHVRLPSCSAVDLAEIRRSFKISSWNWKIIS